MRMYTIISIVCRWIIICRWKVQGSDQSSIISESNSKNVIASMKNVTEYGRQADPNGLYPDWT